LSVAAKRDSETFDAIVLGAGPAGEVVVTRLVERGLHTALVEAELIGGECAYWACIPSKTLLRPTEVRCSARRAAGTSAPAQDWHEIAAYRDYMIRHLEDANEVTSYEQRGVTVIKGSGRLTGPHTVAVGGRSLNAERIVIATGSETRIPSIEGLQRAGYWTNREATTLGEVPDSVVILGGGPVGIELAQMLRRFGADVAIVETADRLLAREDHLVSALIADSLRGDGIELHLGAQVESVASSGGRRTLKLGPDSTLTAQQLIVAVGRTPRIGGLSLENAGIKPDPNGISVDERCRAAEGIWAVGDVTGAMPFTHVAKYQARIACADIAGEDPRADYKAVPRVVFCDPEVAAVGLTEREAATDGVDVVSSRIELRETIARPSTYEIDPRGELAVIADRRRRVLVGAWAVAPLAGEWIHYAALAIKAEIPLEVLVDSVAQFPTYTEAYLQALERLGI
jgi:pyruvate/2-oxoglutarate dehydrogenase complex dihydrolipoamide dehydrogenase (E3) component